MKFQRLVSDKIVENSTSDRLLQNFVEYIYLLPILPILLFFSIESVVQVNIGELVSTARHEAIMTLESSTNIDSKLRINLPYH